MEMNLKSIVVALLIFSLIGTLLPLDEEGHQIEAIFIGHEFILQFRHESNPLNLTSRANIYNFIQSNPGAHLRKICTSLSISIGSAQYHLEKLIEGELIESEKESKYKRFFVTKKFSEFEKKLIAFLRKPKARMIVKYTSSVDGCTHQELAKLLDVSSQAVTWHVKQLLDDNVVESWVMQNSTYYRVTGEAGIALMTLAPELCALVSR